MEFTAYTILLAVVMLIGLFQCLTMLLEGRSWHPIGTLFVQQVVLIAALMVRPSTLSMTAMWATNPMLIILGIILLSVMVLAMLRSWTDMRREDAYLDA